MSDKPASSARKLLVLLLAGWVLLFLAVAAVTLQLEFRRLEREVVSRADEIYGRVEQVFQQSRALLQGFSAALHAHPEASLEERTRLAARLLADAPGTFLEIVDRVGAEHIDQYLGHMRATVYAGFDVRAFDHDGDRRWRQVRGRTEYYPLGFIAPLPPDTLPVLGLDLSGHELLFPVLSRARDSGEIVAMPPFVLAEGQQAYGLAVAVGADCCSTPARPWQPAFVQLIAPTGRLQSLLGEYAQHRVSLVYAGQGAQRLLVGAAAADPAPSAQLFPAIHYQRTFSPPYGDYRLQLLHQVRAGQLNWVLLLLITGSALVALAAVMVYAGIYHRHAVENLRGHEVLFKLANFDSLTGLPNRNLLMDRLELSLARSRRTHQLVVVLFLDLDGFKQVNDGYGHRFGDEVLRQVAGRISELLRESDTIARLGGDEFVVLLDQLADMEAAEVIAESIRAAFQAPFGVGRRRVHLGVSIGAAAYPRDADTVERLLHRADVNMYRDKRQGASTAERRILDLFARVPQED